MEVCILFSFLIVLLLLCRFILDRCSIVCPPDQILVLIKKNNYRIIQGGRAFYWPIFEKVSHLTIKSLPIGLLLTNVTTKDGPITLTAMATIRISIEPSKINNAIDRFSNKEHYDIQRAGKEIIESHLRDNFSVLSIQDIHSKRRALSDQILNASVEDLQNLGLDIEIFTIQSATS